MARETKVGLIVGLGVILFVSVFVSDYLSVPESAEALSDAPAPNFVERTTNQPEFTLVREEETDSDTPIATDPRDLAAVSLETIEEIQGSPELGGPPPFREATEPLTGTIDDSTPLAQAPEVNIGHGRPIGVGQIDDTHLARDHQLDAGRTGPGLDAIGDTIRVDIPEPVLRDPQTATIKHTVKPGETLTSIARKHYDGDGNLWRSIRDANPGKVGANGEIVQGVVLTIPKRSIGTENPGGELADLEADETSRPERKRVRVITVQEGQTVSELAYEHLGSANKWQLIMDVNTDVLEKPEHLRAGMKLRIPAERVVEVIEEANEALAGPLKAIEDATSTASTYTVKEGDNLSTIAGKLLGDPNRSDEIFQANKDKLNSADKIRVGMKLKLPAR